MLLTDHDRFTGLPLVHETRDTRKPWYALPRAIQDFADPQKPDKGQQTWLADWQVWDGPTLIRTRCWKCGNDLKAWRQALDQKGQPIVVGGQPAVAFLLLPTFRQTLMRAHLPTLDRRVTFAVLHCADCIVTGADGLEAVACYLQGVHAGLTHAWTWGHGKTVTADHWASFLVRFSGIVPDGVEDTMDGVNQLDQTLLDLRRQGYDRLPVPGEILTAARYLIDYDQGRYGGVPSGVTVEFQGGPVPPGWVVVDGMRIKKL